MSRNASLLEANKVLKEKYTKVKGVLEEILVADISQVVHDKITALGFSSRHTQPREIVCKPPCVNPPTPVSRQTSAELEHHDACVSGDSPSSPHLTSQTLLHLESSSSNADKGYGPSVEHQARHARDDPLSRFEPFPRGHSALRRAEDTIPPCCGSGLFPSSEPTRTGCHPVSKIREDRHLAAYMTSCQPSDDGRSDFENIGQNMTASTTPHELS